MNKIYLRKGRDYQIRNRHHWIFSGALKNKINFADGEIAQVFDNSGNLLGHGYFNRKPRTLSGRMINFSSENPIESIRKHIRSAYNLRKGLFDESETNSYRLINGEGDLIPGLIVDKYANDLVIQVGALGIEKIKDTILDILVEEIDPEVIFEKSSMPSRKEEGLTNFEGLLYQKEGIERDATKTIVLENGNKFEITYPNSHKTGFYLDQREMRSFIADLTKNRSLLNCFSYTGGFSVAAAKNGSPKVTSVDISKQVISIAERNFEINDLDTTNHEFIAQDVFRYLEEATEIEHDVVILDPPAFAKSKSNVSAACSGYRKLNRYAMKKMKPGSFLLTCSCSYHVDEELFLRTITEAALDAKREIKVISSHRRATDHTINLYHPEMDYLKSFLLYIV